MMLLSRRGPTAARASLAVAGERTSSWLSQAHGAGGARRAFRTVVSVRDRSPFDQEDDRSPFAVGGSSLPYTVAADARQANGTAASVPAAQAEAGVAGAAAQPPAGKKRSWSNRSIPSAAAHSSRLRKSPFFEKTIDFGVTDFTVYNRMLMPLTFGSQDREYKALTEGVAIWDVSAERQVELRGPDAFQLAQYLTCRDISKTKVGTCVYAIMCDNDGVVINDPVLLKLAEDRYWFSIADSDVLLWAKAMAIAKNLDVRVTEPDVSPLALQGPKSLDLVSDLFGREMVESMKYFHFRCGPETVLDGDIPILLARSGWSPEHGYELYLLDGSYGDRLWDLVVAAGRKYGIEPGAPNQPRRIEGGMLSFGGDTLPDTNALELGLPRRFVDPYGKHDFVGKEALQQIHTEGVRNQFVGFAFDPHAKALDIAMQQLGRGQHHPVYVEGACADGEEVGYLTALAYSPRFGRTLGLGFVSSAVPVGTKVKAVMSFDTEFGATVSRLPFKDVESGRLMGRNSLDVRVAEAQLTESQFFSDQALQILGITSFNEKALRRAFEQVDADRSGKLDAAELRHLFLKSHPALSASPEFSDMVRRVLGRLDLDADKGVSWPEFKEAFVLYQSESGWSGAAAAGARVSGAAAAAGPDGSQ